MSHLIENFFAVSVVSEELFFQSLIPNCQAVVILFRGEVKFFLNDIRGILHELRDNKITVDEAYLRLKEKPFEDIGYAKVDLHRKIRQGASEVIYGAGKTPEQIAGIIAVMKEHNQGAILITRLSSESAEKIKSLGCEIDYHADAHVGICGNIPQPEGKNFIVVATGGTSDIPVAEEAALTAEVLGNRVKRLYDVGVSGLHRVLSHIDDIMSASVIVAVAGMEGALASVLGGLADCPVIAVPTSVGYGASFGGVAALLAMLNSCASGVSVVNIDNGFGAGYLAGMINRIRN
ncbi:MAG: nickel pincer cofactor biosynthesis protein LarB [Synergistaceae bacterium]|nr:nickel pincer cofactor biosynthesis protein LarB [Synergistaceae bacterium]